MVMATNLSLTFNLTPVFDVQAFNTIVNTIKDSLGPLGQGIKPIDENKFNAALNSVKSQVQATAKTFEQIQGSSSAAFSNTSNQINQAKSNLNKVEKEAEKVSGTIRKSFLDSFKSIAEGSSGLLRTVLGVFGGGVLLKGFSGIFGGFADIIEKGKAATEAIENMKVAFAQAGKSGEELSQIIKESTKYAAEIANRYGVATAEVRRFSQLAAALGGATGQANKDLVTLALAIEKTTNGLISGEMAIRIFSKGVADPESEFALGRLTKQFPALAATLKDMKDPAQATAKALQFFSPALKQMEENAQSSTGSAARFQNSINSLKVAVSKIIFEAVDPFIYTIDKYLIPILQGATKWVSNLINLTKPLQPVFVAAGVAASGLIVSLLALQGIKTFAGLVSSATQFGLTILQKVIPALVAQNAATGTLVLQKNALTVAVLKDTAATYINIASKNAYVIATKLATAAQNALNAAFRSSPIGLVITGIGALAAGMILLYKNSQAFRNIFDGIWKIISTGATYAWQIIKKIGEVLYEIGKIIVQVVIAPFQLVWTVIKSIGETIGDFIAELFNLESASEGINEVLQTLGQIFEWITGKVEKVLMVIKSISSAIGSFISSFGKAISNLLKGDIIGFIEGIGEAGKNAGEAFVDKLTEELNKQKFEDAAKEIQNALQTTAQIQIQIDKKATAEELIKDYEDIQKEIESLTSKGTTIGLSDAEKEKLEELKKKALEVGNSIAEIFPEARNQMRNIVDDTGKIKTVWEVNIQKAKEYVSTALLQENLLSASQKFTQALQSQTEVVQEQKAQLKDLQNQIVETTDPEKVEELKEEYEKLTETFNQNKEALVQSFLEGAQAGLVTQESIQKIAETLEITNEEAKNMAISKELEEASKKGNGTAEVIEKIANKWGVSREKVQQILDAQRKVTQEIKNSEIAAQSFADALSMAKQKQEEGRGLVIKAVADLKAGRITQEEYNKRIAEGIQKQKEGAQIQTELNEATKEANKLGLIQKTIQDETAEKEKERTKEKQSQLALELEIYQKRKQSNDNYIQTLEIQIEKENLLAGRLKISKYDELRIIDEKIKKNKEEYEQLNRLIEKYKISMDEFGRIRFVGKIKPEEASELLKQTQDLARQIAENENTKLRLNLEIKEDEKKNKEELRKIQDQFRQLRISELELKVTMGIETDSSVLAAKLENLKAKLAELLSESSVKLMDPTLAPEERATILQQITDLQKEIYSLESEYRKKLREEQIQMIADPLEREKELEIEKAKQTYEEELKIAKDNFQLRLQAYLKYLNAVSAANKKAANESQELKKYMASLFESFGQTFARNIIDTSFRPLDSMIENLKQKLKDIQEQSLLKANLNQIKNEEKALLDSLRRREISVTAFYQKQIELEEKRQKALQQNLMLSEINTRIQLGLANAFKTTAEITGKKAEESFGKILQNQAAIKELQRQVQAGQIEAAKAQEQMSLLMHQNIDNFRNFTNAALATSLQSFGAMLASGASFVDAFKMGLLVSLIDMAEKMILTYIGPIYAAFFAQLGLLGPVAATGALAVIYAALEAAKAALSAYKGAVDIQGPGTETSDSIPARLSKGESVLTAKATRAGENKELFKWLNQTGRPAIEFYLTQKPVLLQQKLGLDVLAQEKELVEKQRDLLFSHVWLFNQENNKNIQRLETTIEKNIKELQQTIQNSGYVRKTISEVNVDIDFNAKEIVDKVKIAKELSLRRL